MPDDLLTCEGSHPGSEKATFWLHPQSGKSRAFLHARIQIRTPPLQSDLALMDSQKALSPNTATLGKGLGLRRHTDFRRHDAVHSHLCSQLAVVAVQEAEGSGLLRSWLEETLEARQGISLIAAMALDHPGSQSTISVITADVPADEDCALEQGVGWLAGGGVTQLSRNQQACPRSQGRAISGGSHRKRK